MKIFFIFKIWMRKNEEFEISSYKEERAKEISKKEEEKKKEIMHAHIKRGHHHIAVQYIFFLSARQTE